MSDTPIDTRAIMTKALLEIKELKARVKKYEYEKNEPIALVGMACRFPGGANSPDAYWELLSQGVDAIGEVPTQRWDNDKFYDEDNSLAGKICTRSGGFIDDIDGFDASFFGISPREAESLDPHQRILLEVCWEALEHANIVPEALYGSNSGVFVGVSSLDNVLRLMGESPLKDIGPYHGTGCAFAPIAGRISYNFGFNGPSFVVDTACSSSLLSLHLAAESLRRKECNLALAGGVHLIFHPGYSVAFSKANMLAPDGRCKTFDASANGYVRGEGCGIVVMKRLSDAERDGDQVLALLRGSAVNQDGASGGLTVPSGPSQEQVIRQAQKNAGVTPEQISYIEAHGTGTSLGDPIEIGAIANVIKTPLHVGSVKTNIGHLEASAGIASTIKVILALQKKAIPPHLHFNNPNPLIPWNDVSVKIPSQLTPWESKQSERVAGISSFGFSGTNVHLILSEAPTQPLEEPLPTNSVESSAPQLLPLSARNQEALKALAQQWLDGPLNDDVNFAAYCRAAQTARTEFSNRVCVVAGNAEQAREQLAAYIKSNDAPNVRTANADSTRSKVAFLFTGQGAQYAHMGRSLYEREPVFRAAIDACDQCFKPHNVDLLELLYGDQTHELDNTQNTQPALFAIEYALAKQWQAWGVQPQCLIGHSIGEFAAACIAGVFSLEDATKLVAARGRLMQALPPGGIMAAVFASAEKVQAAIDTAGVGRQVDIAGYNAPRNTVISGVDSSVDEVLQQLNKEGVEYRKLKVSHAFHSSLMEPMLEDFRAVAQSVNYQSANIPLISNVTGAVVENAAPNTSPNQFWAEYWPEYWINHVRAAVRFEQGLQTLASLGCDTLIEIGPAPILTGLAKQTFDNESMSYIPSLVRDEDAQLNLYCAFAQLWCVGGVGNWSALPSAEPVRAATKPQVKLPTYPFQHKAYWPDVAIDGAASALSLTGMEFVNHPLIQKRYRSPLMPVTIFESNFSLENMPFLDDHRVFDKLVVAGASHLSLVLSAMKLDLGEGFCLKDVMFPQALVVPDDASIVVQLAVEHHADDAKQTASFRLVSVNPERPNEEAALHAKGLISKTVDIGTFEKLPTVLQRCGEELSVDQVYRTQRVRHIVVGPSYQWLQSLHRGDNETVATLEAPAVLDKVLGRYTLHPGLIDACFGVLVMAHPMDVEESFIPFAVDSIKLLTNSVPQKLLAHAVVRHADEQKLIGDIHLYDQDGKSVAAFMGLEGRRASRDALLQSNAIIEPSIYQTTWEALEPFARPPQGRWLIFSDSTVGETLAKNLSSIGVKAVLAHADKKSDTLTINADGSYQLSPESLGAMNDLVAQAGAFDQIVFAWGLACLRTNENFDAYLHRAGSGALHLVQALANQAGRAPKLLFVTRGVQKITPSDSIAFPQQSLLWGMGRVVAAEFPALRCANLDLDLDAAMDDDRAAADIAFAVSRAESGDDRLAWRDGVGYGARLTQLDVDFNARFVIEQHKTYVITGGAGALGTQLCRWLIQQGAQHIAVLSRRPASPENLAEIREALPENLDVRWYQADVAERAVLKDTLATIASEQNPIAAVFHLAGVVDDALIAEQSMPRLEAAWRPKAQGAWHLHDILRSYPDSPMLVMFGSASSVLGSVGQLNYAAANAFLDGLALHRQDLGLPTAVIHWGPWSDVGMAAQLSDQEKTHLASRGIASIDAAKAFALLDKILQTSLPSATVLAMDWERYSSVASNPSNNLFIQALAQTSVTLSGELRERLQSASASDRANMLRQALVSLVAQVLRLEENEVTPRERLFDLGVDSLTALELKNRLQALLGLQLSSTLLFDYPTIESLCEYMLDSLAPSFEASAVNDVDDVTEEDAEAMLLAQLAQIEGGAI